MGDPTSTWVMAGLWALFAGTHLVMSARPVRSALVAASGRNGFLGLYSVVALATFVALAWYYAGHRHQGLLLWPAPGAGLRHALQSVSTVAMILVAAGVLTPSPSSVAGGPAEPRGAHLLMRHPLFAGIALWGIAHLALNGFATDVVFFGGFAVFAVLGAWHQDRRKLAEGDPAFRAFHAATPFVPLTGGRVVEGLRGFSRRALVAGIVAAVALRAAHPLLFR